MDGGSSELVALTEENGGFVVQGALRVAVFFGAPFFHLNKRDDAWKYNIAKFIETSSLFLITLGKSGRRWDDNIKTDH
jgi:hypothetical protein